MSETVIDITALTYRYPDGTLALEDASLHVQDGERVGLIGANGAGKSTLLLHLNGMLDGFGKVKILGRAIERKSLKWIRQKVGLVFQNPDDQLFCPTVFEDVAFGPQNLGLKGDALAERVHHCLEQVDLPGVEHKSAMHLSLGQKKRLAIATVLAMEPEILVLDEPTIALDPKGRREIIELLRSLEQTQIIATHDLDMMKELCNRVVLLAKGKNVAEGTPEQLIANCELLRQHDML